MKTMCLFFLAMSWTVWTPGTDYAAPSSPDFSPRVWKGGASQAAEKPSTLVILSPFASLRVNSAKDVGSSQESVSRANYGGSSPKMPAQNDSAKRQLGGRASVEQRGHGSASITHPPIRASLTKANRPKPLPNSRQRSMPGNAMNSHPSGPNLTAGAANGGLIQNETVHNALAVRMTSVVRPNVPLPNNVHHHSPNPAVVSGTPNLHSSNAGAINGTRMKRKP